MKIIKDFPLKNITTLEIGGPAKEYIVVKTIEELKEATTHLPYYIVGGGSNLLINDQGLDCLVIKNEIDAIKLNENLVTVSGGTALQELVDFTILKGLSGLESLTGIPGTVGGAIYGNAGAYGQTISDHLISVYVLDDKNIKTLSKDGCGFNYRDSNFKKVKSIILEVTFKLKKADKKALKEKARDILSKRLLKYPKGIKCPGSFFKNIVAEDLPKEVLEKIPSEKIVYGKIPAGALLEEVGAKGKSLGDIEIASYHANLFINKGGGSAEDFYNLAKEYALKVKQKYGITLTPEVQLVNLPPIS